MDMNLLQALPVSKPPPESAVRGNGPAGDARRSDVPSFEETLRARQKEEKQTQTQAEAAASQTAGTPSQKPSAESENQPDAPAASAAATTSDQPAARISGGLPALLNDPVLLPTLEENAAMLGGEEAQAAQDGLPNGLPGGEGLALNEGDMDFASALEQSLSQPAEENPIQSQPSTEVKNEKIASTEIKPEPTRVETSHKSKRLEEAQPVQSIEIETAGEHTSIFHTVSAAKVSSVPAESVPLPSRTLVDMVRQIASQMEASIQQGRSSLRVQLHPQELGGIDIRFASSSQGMSVTVYAEQASTGRLLEAQLNQLRQSLSEAGVNLAQLNIHHESPSHQSQGGFNGHSPRGRSFGGRAIEQSGGLLEGAERWENLSLSGVDYRV